MGWMHDTLEYMGREYIYRKWHHNQLSFSMMYAFSETFICRCHMTRSCMASTR